MTDVLELEMRRRLFALVEAYPGLHVREAARQLGTSVALVEYHLEVLDRAGLVRQERGDRYVRLFAAHGTAALDRKAVVALRSRHALRIALRLLDAGGPVRHKDLAAELGLGKSTLSFHLRKLERAGVVAKGEDGAFGLRDAAATHRLLLAHAPTPELREEFADVWLALYGDR